VFSKGNFQWAVAVTLAFGVRLDVVTSEGSDVSCGLLPIMPSITRSSSPTANVVLTVDAESGAASLTLVATCQLVPGSGVDVRGVWMVADSCMTTGVGFLFEQPTGSEVTVAFPFFDATVDPLMMLVRSPSSDWRSVITSSCLQFTLEVSSDHGTESIVPFYAVPFLQPQLSIAAGSVKLCGQRDRLRLIVPTSATPVAFPDVTVTVDSSPVRMHQLLVQIGMELLSRHGCSSSL
jgi:hypothetical protein